MNAMELHLAINHSPLFATMFAFFFVVVGIIIRNRTIVTAGLIIAIIGALCGIAADMTGDQAADAIDKASPPIAGVDKTLIKEHDEAATWVLTASCVTAGLAVITMFIGKRRGQRPRWMEIVVAVFLLWSLSVVARTALLGGRIHHPEVRPVVRG